MQCKISRNTGPAVLPEPSKVKVVRIPTAPVVSNSSQQVGLEEVVVKLETALASHLAGLGKIQNML